MRCRYAYFGLIANFVDCMYNNLMSLNARAYADIRKYALGAINYAAKHNDIKNTEAPRFALVPVSASFIYDASDEYVFKALGLAV